MLVTSGSRYCRTVRGCYGKVYLLYMSVYATGKPASGVTAIIESI
jgi:hypothetical protein